MQDLVSQSQEHIGYQLKQGRLYYKGRLVIPKNSPRLARILEEFHDSAVGGRSGVLRTYKRVSVVMFWKGVRKSIQFGVIYLWISLVFYPNPWGWIQS